MSALALPLVRAGTSSWRAEALTTSGSHLCAHTLQDNIHHANVFTDLSTDLDLDPDNNPATEDVDGLPTATMIGEYRVVIYSVDTDNLQGSPQEVTVRTGWQVYLPISMR